ncbi:hypothetical protein GCM10022243_38020 [Saccharothrix violaceirubra]|uniref:Uncharacterized protein YukE n=1 Tax=Saccharothrix violaceirubra TaxID=413306 RepID=A0A7W7T480_9PSEU|nr:deaminase domain-containing protein [Saccharothrix violaceirubra]MBB4966284.1 uncharacterized protein YukE [Saccharothrix violaceirubra]
MSNPLVVPRQDTTKPYTGLSPVEAAVALREAIANGDWIDRAIARTSLGLEGLAFLFDPVGSLAAWAVNWLIEQVKPLREGLDKLAGDPAQIRAYADTWKNISEAVTDAYQEYHREVAQGTASWTGSSGDAYRARTAQDVEQLKGAAVCADAISVVVRVAGELVGTVRELVRETVVQCLVTLFVRLPFWLLLEGVTLGLATPAVIANVGGLIAKFVRVIGTTLHRLAVSIARLRPLVARLGEIWEAIRKALAKRRGNNSAPGPGGRTVPPSEGATRPSGTTTPGADATPPGGRPVGDPTTPAGNPTPNGTTTPSGAPTSGTTTPSGAPGGSPTSPSGSPTAPSSAPGGTPPSPNSGGHGGGGDGTTPGGTQRISHPKLKSLDEIRDETAAVRRDLPQTARAKEKTVAAGQFVDENGVEQNLKAISGQNETLQRQGLEIPGGSKVPDEPRFEARNADGTISRPADAEAKILEDLSRRIDPDTKGTVRLWVDHPGGQGPCPSCVEVIKQFRARHPNVRVEVGWPHGGSMVLEAS